MFIRHIPRLISGSIFSCITLATLAAPTASAPASGGNSAVEAALSACASSLQKNASSQPDPAAMDTCMQAKGFTRPSGPPPTQR